MPAAQKHNEAFSSCTTGTIAGLGLTGTKLGCGEGGCGACTVMVSSWDQGKLLHRSINACLCPLYAVEGMHVVTVEGTMISSLRVARCNSPAHSALHSTVPGAPLSGYGCVAGIGNVRDGMHPVQERLAMAHGSQVILLRLQVACSIHRWSLLKHICPIVEADIAPTVSNWMRSAASARLGL